MHYKLYIFGDTVVTNNLVKQDHHVSFDVTRFNNI